MIEELKLTIDQLEFLGNRLDLPLGRAYRARILEEDTVLDSKGIETTEDAIIAL